MKYYVLKIQYFKYILINNYKILLFISINVLWGENVYANIKSKQRETGQSVIKKRGLAMKKRYVKETDCGN